MRAGTIVGLRKIEVREMAKPEPAADKVLIRIAYNGICGSDVHFYRVF